MRAFSDFTCLIKSGDFEGNGAAFNSSNLCFGPDFQTHRGCGQMGDIQFGTDRGFLLTQRIFDGFTGGTFHQGNHAGCGVDQKAAGAYFLGGIFPLDTGGYFTFHSNNNFHNEPPFFYTNYIPYLVGCQ